MKNFLLGLAALVVCVQSLLGYSGSGTQASPYQLGTLSGTTASFQGSGLPSGASAAYYSFTLSKAVAAGSSMEVQYAAGSMAYLFALYNGSTITAGSFSAIDAGATKVRNRVTLASELAAGTYWVRVVRSPATGVAGPNFVIAFNLKNSSTTRPINDETPLGFRGYGGFWVGTNVNATKHSGEANHAGNAGGKSVWYAWHAPATGSTVVSTAGSGFDTLMGIYAYSGGYLTSVASNDDEAAGLGTSRVKFTAIGGVDYYIAVDGKDGASGKVVISLAEGGQAPNAPLNLTPSNNSNQPASVTLKASAYDEANYLNTLAGSQWVVRRASDNVILFNTYVSGSANTVNVSSLPLSTTVRWQVRYQNNLGAWSDFSPATSFFVGNGLSVAVVDGLALRDPLHVGLFRVTRGNSTGSLTVGYTLGGAALAGTDYRALPGSITIPAGSLSADVVITPIPNVTAEKKKSLTLALKPVTGFKVTSGTATLSIRNKLVPHRLVDQSGDTLRIDADGNGEPAEKIITFGSALNPLLFGDFNKDGKDDLIRRSGNAYRVSTTGTGGVPNLIFSFGTSTDPAFIGDLDGDGRDELVVRHGNTFSADTAHNGGTGEISFTFGLSTDELVLCSDFVRTADWDGDGRDDVFLRRGNLFLVRLSSTGAIVQFRFGLAGDQVFLADLNGDGKFEPVLSRAPLYVADVHHDQKSPLSLTFGLATDQAFASDFNGDGRDELFIQRDNLFLIDSGNDGGSADYTITFGGAYDTVVPMRIR